MKSVWQYIKNIFIGIIIGVANIIPGVSGGTMAIVTGVFDKLIDSVSHFFKKIKENTIFLSALGIGMVVGIVALSKGINWLLDNHYAITNLFFIGVIVGSIPMVWKKATEKGYKLYHIIPAFVTFAIMITMMFLTPDTNAAIIRSVDVFIFIKLFLYSILAAVCMILPGISGSFVMLLLGIYESITAAISDFNIPILIPVALGIVCGLLIGVKFIDKVLKKFPQMTYFAIFGFMAGSIPAIIQKILDAGGFGNAINITLCVITGLIGFAVAFIFCSDLIVSKIGKKDKSQDCKEQTEKETI